MNTYEYMMQNGYNFFACSDGSGDKVKPEWAAFPIEIRIRKTRVVGSGRRIDLFDKIYWLIKKQKGLL